MIQVFKLINQEEVIAKVLDETETTIRIKDPFVLMMAGEGRMAVVPWLPLSKEPEAVLQKKNIIIQYDPVSNLVDHYNQQTGSIVAAPAGVLKDLNDWRK